MSKFIVGHAYGFHDASKTILSTDGSVFFAEQTERKTGIKHDPDRYDNIEHYVQSKTAFYEKPYLRMARQLISGEYVRPKETGFDNYISHHWSHAAASYYTKPAQWDEEPVCVVIDAIGEFDTASIWYKKKKVWSLKYPLSLGLFYSAVTKYIGMTPNRDEHLTMALAGTTTEKPLVYTFLDLLRHENCHNGLLELPELKEHSNAAIAAKERGKNKRNGQTSK